MSLTIGRTGLDINFDPTGVQVSGGEGERYVSISGELAADTPDEAKTLRNELWRMTENDDLIIPVTLSADPSLDGYYRLTSADISIQSISLEGWYPFSVQLERFGSGGRVAIESRIIGGIRANDHGITLSESEPIHANPDAAIGYQGYSTLLDSVVRNADNRVGSFDPIRVHRNIDETVSPVWQISPDKFYQGAAYIKAGTTLREMSGLDSDNLPENWELSNGLIRVTPDVTKGRLDVEVYDGVSAWESLTTFMCWRDAGEVSGWHSFTIIRNDPAAITVRLTERITGSGDWCMLDITIRRGAFYAECRLVHRGEVTLGFRANTNTSCTAITPTGASSSVGIRRAANDANGNRWIVGTSKSHTQSLTNGRIEKSTVNELDFAVGFEFNGSSAVTGDKAAELFLQYMAYITEYMNPVLR